MRCKPLLFCLCILSGSLSMLSGQSLAVNTDGSVANASALVDIKAIDKGLLIPRMSRVQRTSISVPSAGLLVYQNAPDSIGFYYYDGSRWSWLVSTINADSLVWKTNGNSNTNPVVHALGTTDANDLVFKSNNLERMRLTATGNIKFAGSDTIYSSPGTTNLLIHSGDGTGNAGSITVRGGNAGISSGGFGGDLNLLAGNAMAMGGSGYAGVGPAGNLNLTAGSGYNNVGGNVILKSGGNTPWDLGGSNQFSKISLQGIGMNANDGATIDVEGGHNTTYGSPPQLSSGGNVVITSGSATGSYTGGNIILMPGTGTPVGKVGVGTASPNSSLHVDGTIAIGVTMGLAGGSAASPVVFSNQKSYVGLTPAGVNVYYKLPDVTANIGRVYYIRNNDPAVAAQLGTLTGLICPGNGACLAAGAYFQINGSGSVKTVIAISDGTNWTVGKID